MTTTPAADGEERRLRFVDAMPRPLLALFALVSLTALVVSVLALLRPPQAPVAVQDRRPPPRGTLSHDVRRVFPAPLPSQVERIEAPCPAVAGVVPQGGVAAVRRLEVALERICALTKGGVAPELGQAARGLAGATIRFADFRRTGVDSTLDYASRTIYLNVKLALSRTPVTHVAPILLHEGWHLEHGAEPVTAAQELSARRVEVAACRELIRRTDWPRWCRDAAALTDLPEARALDLLVAAGYER